MLIAGAGGFAREVLELLVQAGYQGEVRFFDNVNTSPEKVHDEYSILRSFGEAELFFKKDPVFILGVGDGKLREDFFQKFSSIGGVPGIVISPYAQIGKHHIHIGKGVCIATGTVLTTNITIGNGVVVNLNCTIGHDVTIGDFATLSPGVHVSGNCSIGSHTTLGTGAVLLPRVKIGAHAVVGAGAVVTEDVADGVTVTGIPAKPVNQSKRLP